MAQEDKWVHSPQTAIPVDRSSLAAVAREALASAKTYRDECRRDEQFARNTHANKLRALALAEDEVDYWTRALAHAESFTTTGGELS